MMENAREVTKSASKARSYAKTAAKTLSVSRKLLLLRADYYQEGSRMVGALRETLETLRAVGGLLAEPPALRRAH